MLGDALKRLIRRPHHHVTVQIGFQAMLGLFQVENTVAMTTELIKDFGFNAARLSAYAVEPW